MALNRLITNYFYLGDHELVVLTKQTEKFG